MKQIFRYVSGTINAALRIFLPAPVQAKSITPAGAAMMIAGMLLLGACSKSRLRGEGAVISDTRTLAPFTTIDCNGSSRVTVVKDAVYKVVVTGYQKLVPVYETQVSGNRLTLQYKDRYHNIRNDNIVVEVHTPVVGEVFLNGSGNIRIGRGFEGTFLGRINGSGNLDLAASSFSNTTYYISGSGNIDAREAVADTAYATVSGSGNIDLSVEDYLFARISGSGNINYYGDPTVQVDISGSGKIRKK